MIRFADGVKVCRRSTGTQIAHSGHSQSDEDVIQHMVSHFGPVHDLSLAEIMPVSGVTIHVIPSRTSRDPTILFTTGMSSEAQIVPPGQEEYRYTELFVRLPADWPLDHLEKPENFWPIKWIKQIACHPHDNNTWLGGAFAIVSNNDPPEPLGLGTSLSCMMLLCETEELNPILSQDGRLIKLYSLIPLYTEERDLERSQGVGALFDRLTALGVSFVIEPRRINAVTGS